MNIRIETTDTFVKNFKKLTKRYKSLPNELRKLKTELLENPELGIDLGNNVRKIRIAIKSKGRGKSGGARIITHQTVIIEISQRIITLVLIYDKSDKDSISKNEILSILSNEDLI
ncbi:MAG: hypothetical protein B6D61_11535 [Bacteroidetes bacterium 4484_249]|nr:MAG: hypothetical protein B6D61_11535 [Bacteroidetes bacterium 4484_249]